MTATTEEQLPAGLEYAGSVSRRNGAWLINVPDPTRDSPDDEEYDAASSLPVAKRVARDMAADWGYRPAFRWVERSAFHWSLHAREPDDDENDGRVSW